MDEKLRYPNPARLFALYIDRYLPSRKGRPALTFEAFVMQAYLLVEELNAMHYPQRRDGPEGDSKT